MFSYSWTVPRYLLCPYVSHNISLKQTAVCTLYYATRLTKPIIDCSNHSETLPTGIFLFICMWKKSFGFCLHCLQNL